MSLKKCPFYFIIYFLKEKVVLPMSHIPQQDQVQLQHANLDYNVLHPNSVIIKTAFSEINLEYRYQTKNIHKN